MVLLRERRPQNAMIPSPMYLSSVPSCFQMRRVIRSCSSFRRGAISSTALFSQKALNCLTSANITVSSRRSPPSRSPPGFRRSSSITFRERYFPSTPR